MPARFHFQERTIRKFHLAILMVTFVLMTAFPVQAAQETWIIRLDDFPGGLAPRVNIGTNKAAFLTLDGPKGVREFGMGNESAPFSVSVSWQRGGEVPKTVEEFVKMTGPTGWVTPTAIGSGETKVAGQRMFYLDVEGIQPSPNAIPQYHKVVRVAALVLSDGQVIRIQAGATYFHAVDASHRDELKKLAVNTLDTLIINGRGGHSIMPDTKPRVKGESQKVTIRADSGARFCIISGQVEFKHDWDGENAWEDAKTETVLMYGDHIKTSLESECVISFPDMTTYHLEPDSEIQILQPQPDGSKLMLVLGKIWANIKRMSKDGKLEIETTQIAMGIKGTVFSLAATRTKTTLQVLEGSVQITAKLGNRRTALVSGGQYASGDVSGLSMVGTLSLVESVAGWKKVPGSRDRGIPPSATASATAPHKLTSSSQGVRYAQTYPRNDFQLEMEIACEQPGTVLDTTGINTAPMGAWSVSVTPDFHVAFNLWDGKTWSSLTSRATLRRGAATMVQVTRKNGTARLVVGGITDASRQMPTSLSGSLVFIGDFKGDEQWGPNHRIYQGIVGSARIVSFEPVQ